MTGRIHPGHVIARLYRHSDDRHLPWLDDLLITAGLAYRCPPCAAIVATDGRCDECGASDDHPPTGPVRDLFAAYRTGPEAVWPIPALAEGDPPLRLGVTAIGGGTIGHTYAHNDWIYGLWTSTGLPHCGADLRSGGAGKTHRQMTVLLAEHLADDEALDLPVRERLGVWVDQQRTEDGRGD
jgi:hypothetical protein